MNADLQIVGTAEPLGKFALEAGRIVECNAAACGIWGRSQEALAGASLLSLSAAVQADGEDAADVLAARLRASGAGLAQSFAWRFVDRDGLALDCLLTFEPVCGSGPGARIVGRVRDLTDVNAARTALRESEARLRQILDNATAVVYVKSPDGRYLFVNRWFEQLFRVRSADVIGHQDEGVFPPAVASTLRANDARVLEAGHAIEFEEAVALPDGEHTYLSVKFPLFNTEGDVCAVCGISTDITVRKRTEEALRNVALGVSAATEGGIFQAIASYLVRTLGVDFGFVGKLLEGTPSRMQTLAICHDGELRDNFEYDLAGTPCDEVVGQTFCYINGDAQERYPGDTLFKQLRFTSYAGYPLFDSQGTALGLIAVTHRGPLPQRSLTEATLQIFSVRAAAELERLRAEVARRISEDSYRAIFEASEDAIFVHDIDTGAIVDVNPQACRAYGYEYHELLQVDVGRLSSGVYPYTAEQAAAWVRRAAADGPQRVEWHRRNKDGSLHWDEVVLKRTIIAGVERVVAFTREITERKQREESLRKSEDRLRATVEAALDCIIAMDGEGRIVEFNPAAERCFGYRREQVLGKPLADMLIPAAKRDAHREGLARYRREGSGTFVGQRVEVTAMRASGVEFPAELAIAEAQGGEGAVFIGYLRDIAERRSAEEERSLLEAQLRQAQKMEAIGHLSGGVAHDFNNILTGIMGYVVLAEERAAPLGDDKLQRYLERAQQSGQRARDLIRQMLTFSRGQRGEPRPLSLAPLLKESVKLLASTFPATVELRTEFAADLPPVLLDPVHADQVLMNLCINARDAMECEGMIQVGLRRIQLTRAVCASCRQTVNGEFVELSVRDHGPGIPEEHLDRIFEPFFTTKDVGGGSGMGLSTVHGIVHEYGAHILLDTGPGTGAAFRVMFRPLATAQRPLEPVATVGAGPATERRLSGRVLLADDDEAAGGFMEDLLDSWGLEAVWVRNGREARNVFALDPQGFDLAVLDQTMPGMTGMDLTKHLLAFRPTLPVVLYTGYSERLSEQNARAAGARALLRKPVDVHGLFELLASLLTKAS